MALHHRLLGRVQLAVWRRQVFHRPQRHAIDRVGQPDAAVDGAVGQAVTLQFAEHDGAGATITLAATLLGSGAGEVFAQHFEQGAVGGYCVECDDGASADESDRLWFHDGRFRGADIVRGSRHRAVVDAKRHLSARRLAAGERQYAGLG